MRKFIHKIKLYLALKLGKRVMYHQMSLLYYKYEDGALFVMNPQAYNGKWAKSSYDLKQFLERMGQYCEVYNKNSKYTSTRGVKH